MQDYKVQAHAAHIGLDVHKDSIAAAVAVRYLSEAELADCGTIASSPLSAVRLAKRIEQQFGAKARVVYEAGPCGCVLWRSLRQAGYECSAAVPSLIPRRPGDRVKTDRRDARQLARLSLTGLLSEAAVPDEVPESLRDLVRLRDDLRVSLQKQRQQLSRFVLRNGHSWTRSKWTQAHRVRLKDLKFPAAAQQTALAAALSPLQSQEQRLAELDCELKREASQWQWSAVIDSLRALRGIDHLGAVTIAAETGDLRRFASAPPLMSYLGLAPSGHSSGSRRRSGAITKTGSRAVRRILIESAWRCRFPPRQTRHLQRKAKNASDYARKRAWDAQKRLCPRCLQFVRSAKSSKTAVAAIARELAGLVWDIGCHELNRLSEDAS